MLLYGERYARAGKICISYLLARAHVDESVNVVSFLCGFYLHHRFVQCCGRLKVFRRQKNHGTDAARSASWNDEEAYNIVRV